MIWIESPLYQEVVEEAEREGETKGMREAILDVLMHRFGPPAKELELELAALEFDRLSDLVMFAVKCRNLAAFRKRLMS